MPESLFTSQVPTSPNATDSAAYTLGTVIVPAVAGQITHGRWLFPGTLPTGAVAFVLYDATTQAELARATFASPSSGNWNTVALASPVSVSAGQRLVAAVFTSNRYVHSAGFFTSAGLTNGNLSAPATGADPIGNGRFASPADAYPTSTFSGNSYFVDLVFVAGAGTTVVTKSAATSWNVAATVTKSVATTWNTAAVVTKSVATSWGVAGAATTVSKTVATTWNTAAVVTKATATSWATAASVSKSVATLWATAALVSKPVATSWNVAAVATKNVATSWDVDAAGQIAKSVATTWDVAAVTAKAVATTWGVSTVVTKPVATGWETAARVSASVTTTWAVDGSPTAGIVVRPNTGTVGRPGTGTITRPDTGVVVRLYTGTVSRP